MRYSFYEVVPESLDEIEAKACYSVGELGCAREMIALSMNGEDSACLGFGVGTFPVGVKEKVRLYGIAGSYRQWKGCAQLWAIFDAESGKHPIALRRACQQLIAYAVARQGLHRVSLTVKSGYTKGNRFAESLGFKLEGKMSAFLPDATDANLYARLF